MFLVNSAIHLYSWMQLNSTCKLSFWLSNKSQTLTHHPFFLFVFVFLLCADEVQFGILEWSLFFLASIWNTKMLIKLINTIIYKRMTKQNERKIEKMNEGMNEWINACMYKRTNERANERTKVEWRREEGERNTGFIRNGLFLMRNLKCWDKLANIELKAQETLHNIV